MYALFEGDRQVGNPSVETEKEVWEAALIDGLVTNSCSVVSRAHWNKPAHSELVSQVPA